MVMDIMEIEEMFMYQVEPGERVELWVHRLYTVGAEQQQHL